MPFSSGVYTLPANSFAAPVTGTVISSTSAAATFADFTTAFSTCVLKDGTQTMTANIPMGGFKLTGLASGSAVADSATLVQTQNGASTLLTSVGGSANAITASTSPSFAAYVSGQKFLLIPSSSNTAATTLQINSIASPKNVFWAGAACSGGELVASVPAIVEYDGTQFNIVGPTIGTRLTNSIAGNVSLNNTGTFFDGPIVAQGTVGVWFVSGTVTLTDTSTTANFLVKLWDNTTVIASGLTRNQTASGDVTISLSGYISSPAASIRISVKDTSSTSGVIIANDSGGAKDSTLTAIRIG